MKAKIPLDWEEKLFGELATVVKEPYLPSKMESIPYIGLENIQKKTMRLNRVGQSGEVTSQKLKFKKNDILFGKLRPYFEKIIIADFDGICSTDILVVRNKIESEQLFVLYLMASPKFMNYASYGTTGTKMPRIDWEYLQEFKQHIPNSPEERKKISEILHSISKEINLLNNQIEILYQIPLQIFKSLFVDLNGVKVGNNSKKLPKGWTLSPISKNIKIEKGKMPKNISQVQKKGYVPQILIETLNDEQTSYADPKNMVIANKTDTIMVMDGASSGRVSIGYEGVVGSTLAKLTSESHPYFFYFSIKKSENLLKRTTTGSAIPHTDMDLLLYDMDIIIPSDKILNKFEESVCEIQIKIITNKKLISVLTKIRDALLPKLMSGEIRV